jgi:putative transposase
MAFHLQFLPANILAQIPKTTQYDWLHKHQQQQFGHQWFLDNQQLFSTLQHIALNKKLQQFNRILLTCIALKKFITRYKQRIHQQLNDVCAVVVHRVATITQHISLEKCLSILQMGYQQWSRIRKAKRCTQSILHQCIVKHPNQLLKKEVAIIQAQLTHPATLHWPVISIYHQISRAGILQIAKSTFYKYAQLLKLQRRLPKHRRKNHQQGIRADKPLALLHLDITYFKTQDGFTNYLYIIQDNCSRAILYAQAFLHKSAQQMKIALMETLIKYQTQIPSLIQVLSDGGSENKLLSTIKLNNTTIQHLVAQLDIECSNSMVEAAHKNLKYHWLYRQTIPNHQAMHQHLAAAIHDHNNRPHDVLGGLHPQEVLNRLTKEQVFLQNTNPITSTQRIAANKAALCCASYSF